MTDEKVVSIRSAAPSARLKKLDWNDERAQCPHKHIEVWPKEPIIECADCGVVVDPYYWIRQRCHDWQSMEAAVEFRVRQLKDEKAGLEKAIRILKNECSSEAEKRAAARAIAVLPKSGATT
jgi:hypothetical protein